MRDTASKAGTHIAISPRTVGGTVNQKSLVTSALAAAAYAWTPAPASAALIDLGSTTLDTATGLYWLDLTITQGLSIQVVSTNLQPGGLFAGYRFATSSELLTLFAHAGFGPGQFSNTTSTAPPYSSVSALLNLVGVTYAPFAPGTGDGLRATYGNYAPQAEPNVGRAFIATSSPGVGVYNSQVDLTPVQTGFNTPQTEVGSWLVSSVPEASTGLQLAAGLVVLLAVAGLKCRLSGPARSFA